MRSKTGVSGLSLTSYRSAEAKLPQRKQACALLHERRVKNTRLEQDLSPLVPLSPAFGGIFDIKWRGVHPEGETGGEVK